MKTIKVKFHPAANGLKACYEATAYGIGNIGYTVEDAVAALIEATGIEKYKIKMV